MPSITSEVKVGTIVFGFFIFSKIAFSLTNGFDFTRGYPLYVDYNDVLSLQAGAQVRVAGMPVGEVSEVLHMGGVWDETAGHNVFVRVVLEIDMDQREAIRESTNFVIAQEGFVASPYLEAFTLEVDSPAAPDEFVFRGTEPQTFAEIQARAFDAMDRIMEIGGIIRASAVARSPVPADQFINETATASGEVVAYLERENANIDRQIASFHEEVRGGVTRARELVEEWETGSQEMGDLARNLQRETQDLGDQLEALEESSSALEEQIAPAFEEMSLFLGDINEQIIAHSGSIEAMLFDAEELTSDFVQNAHDAQTYISTLQLLDSPVGRLLNEDIRWLDFQELVRDLRIRPWRIMWTQ